MAIPVDHTITLKERETSGLPNGTARFVVNCSCQFEGLAHTIQVAERWLMGHAYAQTQRGNNVIIKRELLEAKLEFPEGYKVE